MRCTVDGASPAALAMPRELQCVRPAGRVSSVSVTTSATFSSLTDRGAPGRGSSANPSIRRSAKRRRHRATVMQATPSRSTIARLLNPSAASNTIWARSASPRATFRRRSRASNSPRSASDNSIRTALGAAMPNLRRDPQRITGNQQWLTISRSGH
jgi:hypothetical protein